MKALKAIAEPILVADRALVEELIHVPAQAAKKVEFYAGASSRCRVLVDYAKAEALAMEECDFYLASGACVDVFHVSERPNMGGRHSVKIRYHLKKHATLNAWIYAGSGDHSCFEQQVLFEEEHGFASLRGLSIVSEKAEIYHKIRADHLSGHCISRQFFKSLVADEAKSNFESLVSVEKGAVKSDSKQLNKNLLLSEKAQALSRPELRIHTDDVACAHGSATGELSADELFYLRSRGIAREQARFMMMEGFAAEAIEDVSSQPLKNRLEELVKKRIGKLMP